MPTNIEIDVNTPPFEAFLQGVLVYVTDFLGGRRAIPEPKGYRTYVDPYRTWNDVRNFFTARGIKVEIEGPFFLKADTSSGLEWPEAVVYVRFLDLEQDVLWQEDFNNELGVCSESYDFEHLQHRKWALNDFRAICGAHPGEHSVVRIDQFDTSRVFPRSRYESTPANE